MSGQSLQPTQGDSQLSLTFIGPRPRFTTLLSARDVTINITVLSKRESFFFFFELELAQTIFKNDASLS